MNIIHLALVTFSVHDYNPLQTGYLHPTSSGSGYTDIQMEETSGNSGYYPYLQQPDSD